MILLIQFKKHLLPFLSSSNMSITQFIVLTTTWLLYSCNPTAGADHPVAASFDTLNSSSYPIIAQPKIFEQAFFKNSSAPFSDGDSVRFFQLNMGKLHIETGKIVAADIVSMQDMPAFTQQFPIGRFAVILSVARFSHEDERIAFSQVLFSTDSIVRWEYGLRGDQQPASIFSDTFYSYGVDAGIGLFIDAKANDAFTSLSHDDPKAFDKYILQRLNEQQHVSWEYVLQDFNGGNMAIFSTGFGDGHYATYIGFNKKGEPCRLLTDFGIVQWWQKR